tara:strand:+ start:15813 stop:16349 length:537 start_codon:yes stop_codon:yes gene_type:complete
MDVLEIDKLNFEVFISHKDIIKKVNDISIALNASFKEDMPICLIVLNGAVVFAAELLKKLHPLIEFSLIKVKSYDGVSSTGKISLEYFPFNLIKNRRVLLIEDIVDSGLTLDFLRKELLSCGAKSVECVTLLFKSTKYLYSKEPEYVGFSIGEEFVVGYGMDLNEKGRSLMDIYKNTN